MTALVNLFAPRIKAVAAFVVSGVAAYVVEGIVKGQVLTLHGLEMAAAVAAASFLGVHQAPANRKPGKKT